MLALQDKYRQTGWIVTRQEGYVPRLRTRHGAVRSDLHARRIAGELDRDIRTLVTTWPKKIVRPM